MRFSVLLHSGKCLDICASQLFLKAGFPSVSGSACGLKLSGCWNSSIWKDLWKRPSHSPSVHMTVGPGHALHVSRRGQGSVYALLSGTIWEDGCRLAAEWWAASKGQGHKLDQDGFFFLKVLESRAQKYYTRMKVFLVYEARFSCTKLWNKKSLRGLSGPLAHPCFGWMEATVLITSDGMWPPEASDILTGKKNHGMPLPFICICKFLLKLLSHRI